MVHIDISNPLKNIIMKKKKKKLIFYLKDIDFFQLINRMII